MRDCYNYSTDVTTDLTTETPDMPRSQDAMGYARAQSYHFPLAPLLILTLVWHVVLATSGFGEVQSIDRFLVNDEPTGSVLGIPRQQIVALNSGAVVVFVEGWQGRNLFVSDNLDDVSPFSDTLDMTTDPALSSADNHAHLSSIADTVVCVLPMLGGDSLLVKLIGTDGRSLWQVDHSFTPGLRANGSYSHLSVYRGGAWSIPGSDTLIMFSRGHDGPDNDLLDIMSFVSADRGRTWSDTIRITDLSDAQDQTRIGGFNFFQNTVTALIFARETGSVLWYDWSRSEQRWIETVEDPLAESMDRGYSGNVIDDSIRFVVCSNRGIESRDTVFWAYQNSSQQSWTRGAVPLNENLTERWIEANLCYVETSRRLVLFHQEMVGPGGDDDMRLFCREWSASDNQFSEPVLVSTGSRVLDVAIALRVPASHGDVAYASYLQVVDGQEVVELARVNFDADPTDSDGDGIADESDNCPWEANSLQLDRDLDNVGDACDNCPDTANTMQTNSDSDSHGDMCDNCQFVTNENQADGDNDGIGDFCHPCCAGLTGNIDCDPGDIVNLSDLTLLVNHLFVTFEPLCCHLEANTDGDEQGIVELSDLTRLINALFVTYEPVAPCQ